MDRRKDFTVDANNFGNLSELVDQVKTEGIKFVVILDPAIAAVPRLPGILPEYPPYIQGDRNNVFIQWANSSYKPEGQGARDDTLYGRVGEISLLFCSQTVTSPFHFVLRYGRW